MLRGLTFISIALRVSVLAVPSNSPPSLVIDDTPVLNASLAENVFQLPVAEVPGFFDTRAMRTSPNQLRIPELLRRQQTASCADSCEKNPGYYCNCGQQCCGTGCCATASGRVCCNGGFCCVTSDGGACCSTNCCANGATCGSNGQCAFRT